MIHSHSLYDVDSAGVTFGALERFLTDAESADLLSESMILELKVKRSGSNVAEAVAGFANTDGGIVLVGVDGSESPPTDRLVGIPRSELDGLIDHLRGLLEVLPEIIPVAIPDTDRLVVVIRVDADTFPHPVMVSGRVMYRVPGATVPADRRRVAELVTRDHASSVGPFLPTAPSLHDPQRFPLWGDAEPADFTIRVIGGVRLAERVLRRPWLTTPARNAVSTALDSSQIPRGLWLTDHGEVSGQVWRLKDRRSTWLTATAPDEGETLITTTEVAVTSGAYVALEGRYLTCLLGTGFRSTRASVVPMSFQDLHFALSAHVSTIGDLFADVADALGVAAPLSPTPWRGWLQAGHSLAIPDVINLQPYRRDSTTHSNEAVLPAVTIQATDEERDQLIRDWLTVFMLDLAVRDFEQDLASYPLSAKPNQP